MMLPTVKLQNLGSAGAVPFTFGQVFAPGHVKPGDLLSAGGVALQIDGKAKHPDGSLRHAVLSGVADAMAAGGVRELRIEKAAPRAVSKAIQKQGLDMARAARVDITVAGVKYSATPDPTSLFNVWLQGPVVDEWHTRAPLRDAAGNAHPHLSVRIAARVYSSMPGQARIEAVVENANMRAAAGQNFTYAVDVIIGGRVAYTRPALTHYIRSRWRTVAWLNPDVAPSARVHPDTAYLIASRVVSHYDQSIRPSEKTLSDWAQKINAGNTGPMGIGPVNPGMPNAGGRPDIAPLPAWTVCYLLSHDLRVFDVMTAAADGAASWPIHYRDEHTGLPVRTDTADTANFTTHFNVRKGPLPWPRNVGGDLARVPYVPDTAHQPSLVFLPYLISGEYYYLEELHFWAAWNSTETDPGYSGNGLGLLRWQQVRGQAWSLRTLGHAAYITPDDHPLKDYFVKQVDNNLGFYHKQFVEANPNPFGMYDGSGDSMFPDGAAGLPGSAPWQDDFLTWAFGYLVDLGFEKALPILQWKAQYIVGRMTSPEFNWIHGADYYFKIRDSATGPVYKTWGEIYRATYGGLTIKNDDRTDIKHPAGLRYIDQPVGSKAMYDWLSAAHGRPWKEGRMFGYADSVEGFPANMQPALSIINDHGAPGAAAAWERYASRADKPDWTKGPQFAIVPRPAPVIVPEPEQPNERCLVEAAIQRYASAPKEKAIEQRALAQEVFGLLLDSERARNMTKQ